MGTSVYSANGRHCRRAQRYNHCRRRPCCSYDHPCGRLWQVLYAPSGTRYVVHLSKQSYCDTYVDLVSGIGLEGHESPYLRGGSDDVILTGHSFSDEPGVYIEGKVSYSLIFIHASHAHANLIPGGSTTGRLLLHRRRWQSCILDSWRWRPGRKPLGALRNS